MSSSISIQLKYESDETVFINSSSDGMEFSKFLATALDSTRVYWDDEEYLAHAIITDIYRQYPYRLGIAPYEVGGVYPTIIVDLHTRCISFADAPNHFATFEAFITHYKEN